MIGDRENNMLALERRSFEKTVGARKRVTEQPGHIRFQFNQN
jgi:hypothetical protein